MDRRRIIYELKASDHLKAECPRCGGGICLIESDHFRQQKCNARGGRKISRTKGTKLQGIGKAAS